MCTEVIETVKESGDNFSARIDRKSCVNLRPELPTQQLHKPIEPSYQLHNLVPISAHFHVTTMPSSSSILGWTSTIVFLLVSLLFVTASACQSCLVTSVAALHRGPKRAWTSPKQIALAASVSGLAAFRNLQRPVVQKSLGGALVGAIVWRAFQEISLLRSDGMDAEEKTTEEATDAETPPMTTAMVATIRVYKNFISPLLPPACRFLPTCSSYGVEAIEKFGPTKGAILTTWRILRCSPLGGRGYDPPRWPPVSYTYSSY